LHQGLLFLPPKKLLGTPLLLLLQLLGVLVSWRQLGRFGPSLLLLAAAPVLRPPPLLLLRVF
jgi:hypothetical protein